MRRCTTGPKNVIIHEPNFRGIISGMSSYGGISMRIVFGLVLSAIMLSATPVMAAGDAAGYVRDVSGDVTLTREGQQRTPHRGDDIFTGDKFVTGMGGRLRIEFADDSDLVLAQKATFIVDEYAYDAKRPKQGKAEFTVLDGAFSYASGWMDKGKPGDSDVKVNLNFGSIGIRGTKLMRAMANKECWIYLEQGAIDVYNKGGKVTLAPGEGTIMTDKAKAPQAPHIWPKREKKWIFAEVQGQHSDWKP